MRDRKSLSQIEATKRFKCKLVYSILSNCLSRLVKRICMPEKKMTWTFQLIVHLYSTIQQFITSSLKLMLVCSLVLSASIFSWTVSQNSETQLLSDIPADEMTILLVLFKDSSMRWNLALSLLASSLSLLANMCSAKRTPAPFLQTVLLMTTFDNVQWLYLRLTRLPRVRTWDGCLILMQGQPDWNELGSVPNRYWIEIEPGLDFKTIYLAHLAWFRLTGW